MSDRKTVYRLKKDGMWLKVNAEIEDDQLVYALSTEGKTVFEADTAEQAEYVRCNRSTDSNNIEIPTNYYDKDEIEVVRINITEECDIRKVIIPTKAEFLSSMIKVDAKYAHELEAYLKRHINFKSVDEMANDYGYDYWTYSKYHHSLGLI